MLILDFLFYSFATVVCIQVVYYLVLFGSFTFLKPLKNNKKRIQVPVSVIICAKNEAKNLKRYLPSILKQKHPKFEVVLINDSSNDETLKVMNEFAQTHNNIKIVDVKKVEAFWGKKKYALTLGIKASTYDHLLFTDADCKTISSNWITEMTKHFNEERTIILGYGGYFNIKKSFINKVIRYETLLTAIQYFSYAKIGLPYMGVGRNLAYHKKEFFKTNGYIKHLDVLSGDDDLFVNEAATNTNTEICFSPKSITLSQPKLTLKKWVTQKRRHISTAKHYKLKHKILLGLFYSSQLLFYCLAAILLANKYYWEFILALIIIRYIAVYVTINKSAKKLKENNLTIFTPILELFLIFIQFGIFINNLLSKPKYWK